MKKRLNSAMHAWELTELTIWRKKMVVTGDDHRDNAEVDVTENMDNSQPNGELVPRTEQNNDETEVR